MREIKFRIWDGHTKSFFNTPDTHYLPKLRCDEEGVLTIEPKDDTYVLQQFTGVTDKNDKEIYEGDIVRCIFRGADLDDWTNAVTIKTTQGVCVGGKPIWPHDMEVIGNIYENPELLK